MLMTANSDRPGSKQTRTYDRFDCIVFLKTKEAFGGLSNMAGGFPVEVNGIRILTAEALYQACRFPHILDVQKLIIEQKSPMTAKMKSKPHRHNSRPDWDRVRVKIMRWCLRVKLAQNWHSFSELLMETGERAIIEESRRDAFWGAKPVNDQVLIGMNVLGRLLMELREEVKRGDIASLVHVKPINIPDFLLYGQCIQPIDEDQASDALDSGSISDSPELALLLSPESHQGTLFDKPQSQTISNASREEVARVDEESDSLKSYAVMKDSGVDWLGEVPEHWEVLPNRALFDEIKDRDRPDEQMLSVTIKRGVIKQARLLEDTSKKDSSNLDRANYKLLQPGDIAYNKMRAWQGAIGASGYRGIISPAYVIERPRDGGEPNYFHHLFRIPQFAKEAERWSYGITSDMWSLRPEHFKLIYSCLPPLPEQTAIVRYLDHVDRRVRRLVRAKRKLIALLTEQKQAIIRRAVTRGLDPNVPLKDSGVEWLGELPEHWEVRKLKFEVTFRGGGTPSKEEPSYWCGQIPWVSPKDMKADVISDAEDHITEQAVFDSSTTLVPAGSILMVVRSGILQRTIPIAICDREVALNQDMKALSAKQRLDAEYFVLMVRGCEKLLLREWTKQGATVESIEHEFLANSEIPLPPIPDQAAIVEYLDQTTADIETTITRAEREIELLNEYRTRLIADVVTGKLDVREVAAKLPEVDSLATEDEPAALDADSELNLDVLEETDLTGGIT